jgi:Domain of unknown function (DUF4149)
LAPSVAIQARIFKALEGSALVTIFSLTFFALLLCGILLGGMIFFIGLPPLAFRWLPVEIAGRFVRQIFRVYYGAGAVLSLLASLCVAWSFAGLALALTGVAFLFALLWLMPAINRNREAGLSGDATAMAAFDGLHRASVAMNSAQLMAVLVAFGLLANRLG